MTNRPMEVPRYWWRVPAIVLIAIGMMAAAALIGSSGCSNELEGYHPELDTDKPPVVLASTSERSQALFGLPGSVNVADEFGSVPTTDCAPSNVQATDARALINRARQPAAGSAIECVPTWTYPQLVGSADAHASYMATHAGTGCSPDTLDAEAEIQGCAGFTGASAAVRMCPSGIGSTCAGTGLISMPGSVYPDQREIQWGFRIAFSMTSTNDPIKKVFDGWVNNPLYRVRLFHGVGGVGVIAQRTIERGIGVREHWTVLDRLNGAVNNVPKVGPAFRWPFPGQQNVGLTQNVEIAPASPDPNGGGIGYAFTYVNEVESQLIWQLRRMCFETGNCYDQEFRTSSSACGVNGCLQMLTHSSDGNFLQSEAAFYTADPLSAQRRYQACVFLVHNQTGAARWDCWEVRTGN